MQRLNYVEPTVTIFPPVTVSQVTTTGLENWRTLIRTPPALGVSCINRPMVTPNIVGNSTRERMGVMQRSSPQGVYVKVSDGGRS